MSRAEKVAKDTTERPEVRLAVLALLNVENEEDRRKVLHLFCNGCGTADLPCPCQRDE